MEDHSLASLLAARRPADAPVAFERAGIRGWHGFLEHVEGLAKRLAGGGGRCWLLDCTSSYGFAVGLFGAARAGGIACVPPNRQPGTLRQLASRCDAVIRDEKGPEPLRPVLHPLAARGEPRGARLSADVPLLRLYTSGTAGPAKEIPKSWCHLDEVFELERHFGPLCDESTRVFATAPHQHLYGLLFRVLWPLAAGRPFQAESLLHVEELLPRMAESPTAVLVATPVQLRRLVARRGLASLRGRLRAVFSSGGPLAAATARAVEKALGSPPIEIFGSTETGGVAQRQQRGGQVGPPWRPFGPVRLRREETRGCLRVRSPFVSVGVDVGDGELECEMGDRGRLLADGRFVLEGRADRIVKIGEKRLALPDMESGLQEHEAVQEAVLGATLRSGEPRVGALIVLSPAGRTRYEREGRRALTAALSAHLAPHWDPILLPRLWRFPRELPRDERGKLPQQRVDALLSQRPREPQLLREERDVSGLRRLVEIPMDLAQLEGHFPGHPIVPGVAWLGWALDAATEWLGSSLELRSVETLKFKGTVSPGARAWLVLTSRGDGSETDGLRFRVEAGGREVVSGRLGLAR